MFSAQVQEAAKAIQHGGIVAFPTETFYGLAVDPMNPDALRRLIALKGRDAAKGIPVIAPTVEYVDKHFKLPPGALEVLGEVWPAPLTLALEPGAQVPAELCGDFDTVAVRVSDLELARALAELAGGMITSTSANLSGEPPVTKAANLSESIRLAADFIIDGTPTQGGEPSSIVGFTSTGIRIFREGAYPREEIERRFEGLCQG